MGAAEVIADFGRGLDEINLSGPDDRPNEERGRSIKRTIATIYDASAAGALKGEIWNWGVHDDSLAEELERRLPGVIRFDTDGFSEQLYLLALRDAPVPLDGYDGMTVLEVGCGLGEGLNLLSRLVSAKSMVGLDLAPTAIARAEARLSRGDALRFVEGDAEELPFEDGSIDVVVTVESSHNYPDLGRFLTEVARVLRPGGVFSHLDLFTDARLAEFRALHQRADGLKWTRANDISSGVRAAISARMAPGSRLRTVHAKYDDRPALPVLRRIEERYYLVRHGADFAGFGDDRLIRGLKAARVLPRTRVLPVTSYRHHVAVRA